MEKPIKNKNLFISVPVDEDIKQAVDDKSWQQRISAAEYVRRLIYKDLKIKPST